MEQDEIDAHQIAFNTRPSLHIHSCPRRRRPAGELLQRDANPPPHLCTCYILGEAKRMVAENNLKYPLPPTPPSPTP